MEIYESQYMTINYHSKNEMLECVWNILSVELTPEKMKQELSKRLECIEQYRPQHVLINAKEFFYKIPPQIQTWVNKNIRSKYLNIGVKKMAYIISDDVVAQISIEQTIQEEKTPKYEIRYFESEKEAKEWLSI